MNETAASPAPASRRRRAAIGTVAALSTAGLTAGIAFGIGAPSGATPVAEQSSWAHVQPAANGFGGPGWPGGGGDGGYGWGYGNGSGSGNGNGSAGAPPAKGREGRHRKRPPRPGLQKAQGGRARP